MTEISSFDIAKDIQVLITELSLNHITPEVALAKAKQYGFLRRELGIEEVASRFTIDTLVNKELFKKELLGLFKLAITRADLRAGKIGGEDTLFNKFSEKEIAYLNRSTQDAASIAILLAQRRREKFLNRLNDNLFKQLQQATLSPGSQQQLDRITAKATTSTEVDSVVAKRYADEIFQLPEAHALPISVRTTFQAELTKTLEDATAGSSVVSEAIVTNFEARTLAVIIEKKLQQKEVDTKEEMRAVVKEAEATSRMLEVLTADNVPSLDNLRQESYVPVFEALGTHKGLGRAADVILNTVNTLAPGAREKVINQVISSAFHDVTDPKNKKELEKRLGVEFVQSSLFQQLREAGQRGFGIEKGRVGPWIATAERFIGTPREAIYAVLELHKLGLFSGNPLLGQQSRARGAPPSPAPGTQPTAFRQSINKFHETGTLAVEVVSFWSRPEFYYAILHHSSPGMFHFEFLSDIAGWVLHWGAKKGVSEGTKAVASTAVKTGAKGIFAKLLGATMATIATGPAGPILGWLGGEALTRIGGRLLGGIFGGLKNLLTGGFLTGPGKPDSTSTVLVLALTIVPILLIMLLGMINTSTIMTAFSTTGQGGGPPGGIRGTAINYTCERPDSETPIATCPVSGGEITQLPYQEPTSKIPNPSHRSMNAYDIGGLASWTPVVASHKGVVVTVDERIGTVNTFGIGGYGNYVKLVGTTADGKPFYTVYAHLAKIDKTVGSANNQDVSCSAPTTVEAGQIVGYLDSTGNSSGPHLHYEYDGPGQPPTGCGYNF